MQPWGEANYRQLDHWLQLRVKLNNNSIPAGYWNVPAGVAQATRLGPWLFLVMINDLKVPGESFSMWKFADSAQTEGDNGRGN